ncbi:ACP phosphodiesterase [Fulvivirga sedimenti]|uniref:ACP phosphodiesterase n=1 Tax=Fulvivirga sedimenti TaxID=2879465 RepID=A0A9X1KZ68_9BACT|nr:ACP phosphodiesterase [Fulvivirga sedimenti]MCA6077915.1 ACP phosphodiesterase [Fulvivirga sedimenti]
MNFLAHLYLSGQSEPIAVGNFIGDFVKGNQYNKYPKEIQNGVLLHREIDAFTDSHPEIREGRKRLWDPYRHYSGVIMDLFCDHFLAKQWESYHDDPLEVFARNMYALMDQNNAYLPQQARNMLPYMKNGNWLVSYGSVEGIDRALTGLSRRTSFRSGMENAANDLAADYTFFNSIFNKFFPDMIRFASTKNPYFT